MRKKGERVGGEGEGEGRIAEKGRERQRRRERERYTEKKKNSHDNVEEKQCTRLRVPPTQIGKRN